MLKIKFIKKFEIEEEGNFKMWTEKYQIGNYEAYIDYVNGNIKKVSAESSKRYGASIHTTWKESKVEIQTTSFGGLEIADFKEFMECQKEAVEVAELLQRALKENVSIHN